MSSNDIFQNGYEKGIQDVLENLLKGQQKPELRAPNVIDIPDLIVCDVENSHRFHVKEKAGQKWLFDNRIEKFATDIELAEILNISVDTVRKWTQQRRIPSYKFGRSRRYNVDEVLAKLKENDK